MSLLFPTNDTSRLATTRDVLRRISSQLSSSPVSIPEHEVSELRAAMHALQEDMSFESGRKEDLKGMRAIASQRMPYLRQQVRGIWSAARFYIDNLVGEKAMLRASVSSSVKPSKPDDVDEPAERAENSTVEPSAIKRFYQLPDGPTKQLRDLDWVEAARHLAQALSKAPEAGMPVFQSTTADQLLVMLDGLEEAVAYIDNDRGSRNDRQQHSRKVRERVQNALSAIASTIRYQCRGASLLHIRQKQRDFGFDFKVGSAGSSETQTSVDNPTGSDDSAQAEDGGNAPIIQPEPNLEAEGTLG